MRLKNEYRRPVSQSSLRLIGVVIKGLTWTSGSIFSHPTYIDRQIQNITLLKLTFLVGRDLLTTSSTWVSSALGLDRAEDVGGGSQ